MHILVVEDEPAIADFLARGLRSEGYAVTCAADAAEGERAAVGHDLDLVVLDLVLPDRSGLEVLGAIRAAKPALPVIVLSARAEVEDRVAGLDLGANDYVAKPFSFEELAARVRANLRRPDQVEATRLSGAGIELDLVARTVSRNGTQLALSPREFDLLAYFLRHPNQVLSREQLLNGVWGYAFDPGTNVVEVYVGYLRRKLAGDGTPAPIETLRSVGYKLVDRA
jgi:DNA-binding response OmpR family regulator